ncbi:MAG: glycosyltransferase [Candidatus Promineifilaceae bacterium]|nr:glycosyltransferase [Candidatus Promineifilaceae bacterium]
MKIGLFLSSLGLTRGGLESIAAGLAGGLARQGHEVTAVAGWAPGIALPADLAALPIQWVRVPCLPLARWGRTRLAAGLPGRTTAARARPIRWQAQSYLWSLYWHGGGRRALAESDVSISFMERETVALSCRRGRAHLSYFSGTVNPRMVARDCSTVRVALSRTLAESEPDVAVDGVVWPGLDAVWLAAPYVVRARAHRLVFVGRLAPSKGLRELTLIFTALASTDPALRLTVVGAGPLRGEMAGRLDELGLSGRVQFLGTVERPAVLKALQAADLFILPSQDESFGLAAAEAQAAGVPVLCSDLPGLREATGGEAHFVAPDDLESWIQSARQLLWDEDERRRLSKAGRMHAAQLTWQRAAEALEPYLTLAATGQGRRESTSGQANSE